MTRVTEALTQTNVETPGLVVSALRSKQLAYRNSKQLHEAYFGNLGGSGTLNGPIEKQLAASWGSVAKWQERFVQCAKGLGGGSGWAVLSLELRTQALVISSLNNHTQSLSASLPLLVLDMYEHSYHMDYGSAHKRYIEAFFANVNWDRVNARLEAAQIAGAAWARR